MHLFKSYVSIVLILSSCAMSFDLLGMGSASGGSDRPGPGPVLSAAPRMVISSPSDDLMNAIIDGNTADAQTALRSGADVNAESWINHMTPLAAAIFHDRPDIIPSLVRYGANVNGADRHGHFPLTQATFLRRNPRRNEVVQALLDGGANPNNMNANNNPALNIAASMGDMTLVRLLVEYPRYAAANRINLCLVDNSGTTPAEAAEVNGRSEVHEYLKPKKDCSKIMSEFGGHLARAFLAFVRSVGIQSH